jgi:ribonuclease PH
VEIQRLIGRTLRSVVNLSMLGIRSLLIDCDVLQADGGTRTASINGAFLALALAINRLMDKKLLEYSPLIDFVAATSVGIIGETPCLDLNYEEDSRAAVDMNLVMTGNGRFVEIQGTAEKQPFTAEQLQVMLGLGALGIKQLIEAQKSALAARGINLTRLGLNKG